ncbi:transposase IS4 family protein [Candidatus Vecturithrix granuli]|uniref:Transposase IS4 family protein n=1 Tax=Vecturithrix granuli TaxID=1499967 RepID=A0A081C023_VECG1|nr:transposase IS4 family protein [Candidatus Vecturithrix granuli]
MIHQELLDLYTDYLLSSFSLTTATGLAELVDQAYSHDQITRFLSKEDYTPKTYWQQIKSVVRQIETDDGIVIVDDTIEEKPSTDENEIVCWHYDHTQSRNVKGINLLNFVYYRDFRKGQEMTIPLAWEVVAKAASVEDPNTHKKRRKSLRSKNEMVRERLRILTFQNRIRFRYIVFDSWFSSKENMTFIRQTLHKEFVCAMKANRTVAVSLQEKTAGKFVQVSALELAPNTSRLVYLKGLDSPVCLAKQVFTNKDGSLGVLYLVSSDTALTYQELTTIYHKRWKVEEFHQSVKQHASLEKSPTKTVRTQKNHIFASLCAFVKLERLKLCTKVNRFAIKHKLYLKALQACFKELTQLKTMYNI